MITIVGLTLALCVALILAGYALLSRVFAVQSEDPVAFAIIYDYYAAILALLILIITPKHFNGVTLQIILVTVIATICFAAFEGTQFFVRKHLEASRSTLIFQISPITTFIVSLLLLHESHSPLKIIAVALVILGNLIAFYHAKNKNIYKGAILYAVLGSIGLGLGYVGDKVASPHYPLIFYTFVVYFLPGTYVLFWFLLKRRQPLLILKKQIISGSWKIPVLAIVNVGAYVLFLKVLITTQASVSVPIMSSSSLLTAFGGIFLLKEKSDIWQKILGVLLVTMGLILLTYK